ncbi:MotA/TolQ/ExbB proton channel family protein [Candidatus Babeliales bacterium]|nr:MotA/TolQ/ExbB proton channel family protein [Candidatus Babeliales bacterium]
MFGFLFNSSSWELIRQSDFFTKLIVFSLFGASITCVAIIILKLSYFKKEVQQMKNLLFKAREARSFDDFLILNNDYQDSLGGLFLSEGIGEVRSLLKSSTLSGDSLSKRDIGRLDVLLGQFSDNALLEAESYLPVLGVSGAVSPLIGLFGTIWGLIHAFVSIGQEKSADLAVVAPGIAEALITTLVGLVVAIPAVIFFHYFSNELRKVEHMLGHLSERFISIVLYTYSKEENGRLTSSREISQDGNL